jgi:hypothetical protein
VANHQPAYIACNLARPKTIQFVLIQIGARGDIYHQLCPMEGEDFGMPFQKFKKTPLYSMSYKTLFIEHSLILPDSSFGTCFALLNVSRRQETMELIFAMCSTGLGLFGSMLFIWKGHNQ